MELQDQHNEIPNNYQGAPGLSRRSFLKRIGAVALGAVAASALTPEDIQAATAINKRTFKKATIIALGSPLYTQAVQELAAKGFQIDSARSLDQNTLLSLDQYPGLVSIVFNPVAKPDAKQSGAVLVVTVDLANNAVHGIIYNTHWCHNDHSILTTNKILADGTRRESKRKISSEEFQPAISSTQRITAQFTASSFTCGGWYYNGCYQIGDCGNGTQGCLVGREVRSCSNGTYEYRQAYYSC